MGWSGPYERFGGGGADGSGTPSKKKLSTSYRVVAEQAAKATAASTAAAANPVLERDNRPDTVLKRDVLPVDMCAGGRHMGVLGMLLAAGLSCAAAVANSGTRFVFQNSPPETACSTCHRFPERLSHPIGVAVVRRVELPLDAGGRIACATCHDPGAHSGGTIRNHALRLPAPDLCRQCHDEPTTTAGGARISRAEHGIALGRAHFATQSVQLSSYGIDAISRACLGCHDGSVAREHRVSTDAQSNHPIGRPYDPNSRGGRKGHLRPRTELPSNVQLPGDTVGCSSCHSPFSTDKAMLTQPIHMSQLCYSCHAM